MAATRPQAVLPVEGVCDSPLDTQGIDFDAFVKPFVVDLLTDDFGNDYVDNGELPLLRLPKL